MKPTTDVNNGRREMEIVVLVSSERIIELDDCCDRSGVNLTRADDGVTVDEEVSDDEGASDCDGVSDDDDGVSDEDEMTDGDD